MKKVLLYLSAIIFFTGVQAGIDLSTKNFVNHLDKINEKALSSPNAELVIEIYRTCLKLAQKYGLDEFPEFEAYFVSWYINPKEQFRKLLKDCESVLINFLDVQATTDERKDIFEAILDLQLSEEEGKLKRRAFGESYAESYMFE